MTKKQKQVRDQVAITLLKLVCKDKVTDDSIRILVENCQSNYLTRMNIICTMANYTRDKAIYGKAKQIVLDRFHYEGDTAQKREAVKKQEKVVQYEAWKTGREAEQKRMCAIVSQILSSK